MPSGIDAQTGIRQVLNPGIVYAAGRRLGPTRGGVTVNITREYVQPEMDGVNQRVTGIGYIKQQQITLEFSIVEFSTENLSLASHNRTGTGTGVNLTANPFANMTLLDAYASNIQVFWQFLDGTTPGWYFITIPTALVETQLESGADGTMSMRFTVSSYVAPANPDAIGFTQGRVAALPTEVGGP